MPAHTLAEYGVIIALAVTIGCMAYVMGDRMIVFVCAVVAGLFTGWLVADWRRWRRG